MTAKAVLSSRLPGTFLPLSRHLRPACPAPLARLPGTFVPQNPQNPQ